VFPNLTALCRIIQSFLPISMKPNTSMPLGYNHTLKPSSAMEIAGRSESSPHESTKLSSSSISFSSSSWLLAAVCALHSSKTAFASFQNASSS
jgi:hypothetical protein